MSRNIAAFVWHDEAGGILVRDSITFTLAFGANDAGD